MPRNVEELEQLRQLIENAARRVEPPVGNMWRIGRENPIILNEAPLRYRVNYEPMMPRIGTPKEEFNADNEFEKPKRINRKKKVEDKKEVYEDGYITGGYRMSRPLSSAEHKYLRDNGYESLILAIPSLLFVEKKIEINNEEECIVIILELADFYALEDCKQRINDFNIEIHNKEYQTSYKKHIKIINSFKRNKNG